AGANEVVVMDCHGAGEGWTFNSLIPDELDPDCEYVVQDHWTEYTEFVEVGETGINAALCGSWGCPVLMVTGDEAACREGRRLLGDGLTTVAVKKGLGRFSARQLPGPKARELIEDGARRALADLHAVRSYDPGRPCEIVVDFNTSEHVEKYRYRAGVEITGSRQITSRGEDWWSAWRQFFF